MRAGQVTKVEAVDSAAAGPVTGPQRTWPTIDSLFALVERTRLTNPAVLKVEYDETYHYPKSIYIDQADKVADDEITYKVDHFTLLSPPK